MDSTDLPVQLRKLLEGAPSQAGTLSFLDAVATVMEDNKTPFFPAYTDHGPEHAKHVIRAAVRLIPDDVWSGSLLYPQDACVLICACLLHDIGLHLREEGFLELVAEDSEYRPLLWFDREHPPRLRDLPWHVAWQLFRQDARHFNKSQLDRLLGPEHDGTPAVAFGDEDCHPDRWTDADRLLIGEFLRRHHARLAHEIAIYGYPGARESFPVLSEVLPTLANPIGLAARSHGESLRAMVDYCEYRHSGNQRPWGTVLPYLMGVLRVADYFQLDAKRAPPLLLRLKNPVSRASVDEWSSHAAISSISWEHRDQLAVYVEVNSSHGLRTHLQLSELLADLQRELDSTTAVLSEVYTGSSLSTLRLSRQRIHTNLDDASLHEQLPYIPRRAALSSDEDLFRLVVSDLYGNQPEVAGRELLQNAVDAVRERRRWEASSGKTLADDCFRGQGADVSVVLEKRDGDQMVLRVADRGIGMTPEVVIDYFLRAGASFGPSRADFEHVDAIQSAAWMKAGRFGVGVFAAFLFGSRVEVETRHVSAARGISFSADIEDEGVQLEWADLPLGTQVSVPFDPRATDDRLMGYLIDRVVDGLYMLERIAGFYRLSKPTVKFQFIEEGGSVSSVATRGDVPTPGERLPDLWRTVKAPGFDAVMWTSSTRSVGGAEVVHNGMGIQEPNILDNHLLLDAYDWSHERAAWLVDTPPLAVFDSRHLLGVALNRYRLKSRTLPFEQELLGSIGMDILGWALAGRPSPHPLSVNWGLAPVVGSSDWVPFLPSLLSSYVDGEICVLWGENYFGELSNYEQEWERAFKQFTRSRGGVPWRTLPFRVMLNAAVAAVRDPEEEDSDQLGLRFVDVEGAVERLERMLDVEVVASVLVREADSSVTSQGYRGLNGELDIAGSRHAPSWERVDLPCARGAGRDVVAYVTRGDGDAVDDPCVEAMLGAADLIVPNTPRRCVALTVVRASKLGRGGDRAVAAPWQLIGGRLERSSAKREARKRAIAAAHPGACEAVERWARILQDRGDAG
jgi:Histidine kinase-, DNA gyrase B-, and HSP90-like ATPase